MARLSGGNRPQSLVHRSRTRGAGIFHPRRRPEAQRIVRLQHQRGGKILRRKAGIEMAEHDLVDRGRLQPRMSDRLARHGDDQALDRLALQLAEARMRPAGNQTIHRRSSCCQPAPAPVAGKAKIRPKCRKIFID